MSDQSAGHAPLTRCRILVRGVNWLGDAVMSTPALLRLREAYPEARIALLTPGKLADLWQHHPALDEVITFTPPETACQVGKRLREQRFQTALILPNSFRSAWESWWARIPERIGYAGQMRTWLLNPAVAPRPGAVRMRKKTPAEVLRLIQARPPAACGSSAAGQGIIPVPASSAHHIYQYLHLGAHLGASAEPLAPRLFVEDSEMEAVWQRLKIDPSVRKPLFALNPGAEYGSAKRWPAERFIAAAAQIQQRTGCRWLVLGGKADQPLASEITDGISHQPGGEQNAVLNLAGATSLRELCAILKGCRVLLTNDTGPMHVAAALDTPVVTPFGSTSPELTGPGLPGEGRHRLLTTRAACAPCFLRECPIDFRCMRSIAVEEVVSAVMQCSQLLR